MLWTYDENGTAWEGDKQICAVTRLTDNETARTVYCMNDTEFTRCGRLLAAAPDTARVCDLLRRALENCLNPDGTWRDLPASRKQELLDLATAASRKAGS